MLSPTFKIQEPTTNKVQQSESGEWGHNITMEAVAKLITNVTMQLQIAYPLGKIIPKFGKLSLLWQRYSQNELRTGFIVLLDW